MKIKYLKNAPLGQVDEIQEVPDDQANVLIVLGFAKEFKPKKTIKKTTENAEQNHEMV